MIGPDIFLTSAFTPFALFACAIALVVLRASGSRVFFDIVGTFQATQMLTDMQAAATVLESLYMDSIMAIQESAGELAEIFTGAVDNVMPLTREIENARVEFEKFVDSSEDAKLIEQQIQDIGLAYGFAADEAFRAGARMAQLSGVLGGGTTPVGTELGMLFGLISGMETEAAMQRLINLNQQTKFMTKNVTENMTAQEKANQIRLDSTRILDQLNTVENRSAATMKQITFVMNQFASQAHLTNESIAAMAAMSATLIETGEEQGKGGRALRMIYARLGADTNGARTAIENLGIAVITTEGEMIPFSKILQELAIHYQTLGGAQKLQLAQSIAGNRHYTRLIKLLENVDRVRELELEALLAQFPARDELQRRLNSEIFAYEQAEVGLKNYSAAFGTALLPHLTAVTNQQALFYKTLSSIAEGPLGFFIGRFIMVTKLMQNFIGPTFAAVIAIKNLSIAMQTQQLVARALSGEVLAMRGGMGAVSQAGLQFTLQENELTTSIFGNTVAVKQNNMALTEEEKALQKNIAYQTLMMNNKELTMNQRAGHASRITILTQVESSSLTKNALALDWEGQARIQNLTTHKAMQQQGELFYIQKSTETALILGNIPALDEQGNALMRNFVKQVALSQVEEKSVAQKAGHKAQITILIKELQVLGITIDEVAMKTMGAATATDILNNKMLQQSMRATMLGMKIGGLGTAFMMFGDSDKSMRMGMILTTAAMVIQMRQVYLSVKAMMEKRMVEIEGTITTEIATWTTLKAAATTNIFSKATRSAAASLFLFDKGLLMVASRFAALIVVLLVVEKLLDALGVFKMPDMTTDIDALSGSVADTGKVIEYLKLTSTELNDIISANEEIIRTMGDAADSAGKQIVSAAETELTAGYAVRDMWALQRIDLEKNKGRVEELIEARQTLDKLGIDADAVLKGQRLEDGTWAPVLRPFDEIIKTAEIDEPGLKDNLQRIALWGHDAGIAASEGMWESVTGTIFDEPMEMHLPQDTWFANWFTGGRIKDRDDALKVMEDFAIDFNELSAWAADKSFENFDAAVSAFRAYVDATDGFTDDELTGGMIGAMSAATEEIYSFNNAREELFFGFSSDRLTGDLIRQVHQQGVETLITTTEVIMTNNFNGMTVPEVADQIIAEIESRGNLSGANFTTW